MHMRDSKEYPLYRVVGSYVLSCGCGYRENKERYRNAWELGPPKAKQEAAKQ